MVLRLHASRQDIPDGVPIDSTRSPAAVVDEIERLAP
jgi:hypothetical protein